MRRDAGLRPWIEVQGDMIAEWDRLSVLSCQFPVENLRSSAFICGFVAFVCFVLFVVKKPG